MYRLSIVFLALVAGNFAQVLKNTYSFPIQENLVPPSHQFETIPIPEVTYPYPPKVEPAQVYSPPLVIKPHAVYGLPAPKPVVVAKPITTQYIFKIPSTTPAPAVVHVRDELPIAPYPVKVLPYPAKVVPEALPAKPIATQYTFKLVPLAPVKDEAVVLPKPVVSQYTFKLEKPEPVKEKIVVAPHPAKILPYPGKVVVPAKPVHTQYAFKLEKATPVAPAPKVIKVVKPLQIKYNFKLEEPLPVAPYPAKVAPYPAKVEEVPKLVVPHAVYGVPF